jgi:hypothetical protein
MTKERYNSLMWQNKSELTDSEIQEGWHWCNEFDGLLVGPGSFELNCCRCLDENHKVYDTTPDIEEGGTIDELGESQ